MGKDWRDADKEGRPGNRGGLGLFKWEDIKTDKDKTHYLGNTVKSSTGRWMRGKKLDWFHTEKGQVEKNVDMNEIATIKRMEAEAMSEALGIYKEMDEVAEVTVNHNLVGDMVEERVIGLGMQR